MSALRRFLIDTDTGSDDAWAIVEALCAASVARVEAITTVCGNFPLDLCTKNALLAEDAAASWPGCEAFFARRADTLAFIAEAFGLTAAEPYGAVKALQAAFDPACLAFSDEYYDVLGLEKPGEGER